MQSDQELHCRPTHQRHAVDFSRNTYLCRKHMHPVPIKTLDIRRNWQVCRSRIITNLLILYELSIHSAVPYIPSCPLSAIFKRPIHWVINPAPTLDRTLITIQLNTYTRQRYMKKCQKKPDLCHIKKPLLLHKYTVHY